MGRHNGGPVARRRPLRTGALYMSLLTVLATVGFGYALWSQSLFIKGEINTGAVSAEFVRAFTDDDDRVDAVALDSLDTGDCPLPPGSQTSCDPAASGPDPKPRWDKDVGRCDAAVVAPDTGIVTKKNVYPGYFCTAWFEVMNTGSVPVRIAKATVKGIPVRPSIPRPFDLDGDGADDVAIHLTGFKECQQVDPGTRVLIDIDQEILQGAPQGSTLSYLVEYTLQQWNEACVEVDDFPNSAAIVGILLPDGTITAAQLAGPTTVHVDLASLADPDGDGQESVQTEIVSMSLTGDSPIGPVEVRLQADRASLGEIEEATNTETGTLDLPPFAPSGRAESFFDVFFEIEIADLVLHNEDPLRIAATITNKPPAAGEAFVMTQERVALFDANGNATGFFVDDVRHVPTP